MKDKFAVRAIIFDDEKNTPILSVQNGVYYKIPGGTIEEGETEMQALNREVLEEAGCKIVVGECIGDFSFYHPLKDRTYHSKYFIGKLVGEKGEPNFDKREIERNFKVIWMPVDEAITTFERINPQDNIEKIIHNRDLSFIIKARNLLNNLKS
jgi:8-oxo-dGTP pyrophosphatase MutT (NUDIX family)